MSLLSPGNQVSPLVSGDLVELCPGFRRGYIEETVSLATPAANFPISKLIPNGAVVLSAQLKLNTVVSATTAVKVGLGRITTTASPSKYALTVDLTVQTLGKIQNFWASPLTADEQIGIFACDTSGVAAGTIGGAGQSATARIVYLVPVTL